jgi:hypothetical protein
MSNYTIHENGVTRPMTDAEKAQWDSDASAYNANRKNRKLALIKKLRLRKLKETDWMANSDVTMPSYIKTWRQSLRDLPQNNTTEAEYDTLLEKQGTFPNITYKHSIWTQPTE